MTMLRHFDRVELERLQRMRECHVADRPTAQELSRALSRFTAHPHRHGRRISDAFGHDRPRAYVLRIALAALAGLLLTLGALAATKQLKLSELVDVFTPNSRRGLDQKASGRTTPRRAHPKPTTPTIETTPRANSVPEPNAGLLKPVDAPKSTQSETSSSAVALPVGQTVPSASSSVRSAKRLGSAASLGSAGSVRPAAPLGSAAPAGSAAKVDSAESPGSVGSLAAPEDTLSPPHAWLRAATALRSGDRSAAEAALAELSRSPDAETRDAALLAQGELDASNGNTARARATFSRLAEAGATTFVRRRARQLLNRAP